MIHNPDHIFDSYKSTTEVIENSASVAMDLIIPLSIRRSGIEVKVSRGGEFTQEYDIYGTYGHTSPHATKVEFLAKLLIPGRQFIVWNESKMTPLLGKFGFVDYEAFPGDILTYEGPSFIQRFRYIVREPESCGLSTDIAFRVKLLAAEDLE